MENFEVKALSAACIFCEKIISLFRFSYTENPLEDLSNKVRHTYDLTLLLKLDVIKGFVSSSSFDIILLQVAKDDDRAIPNDKNWLYNHPKEALVFSETAMVWNTLKKVYSGPNLMNCLLEKRNLQMKMKFLKL